MIHEEAQARMHREQLIREAEQARMASAVRQPGRPLILAAAGCRQWLASAAAGARTGLGTGGWSWSGTKAAGRTR
jgi:hypothetical protein